MNQIIQREYTTKKVVDDDLLLEHGVYCTAPWTSLQIKNDGTMSYCCVSRDPIGLTLNAKELVEGRKRIRRGEILPSCKEACYHTDYVSQRNSLNNRFPIKYDIGNIVDPTHIQYIDLRMGNICNFTCIMCGDRDSHLWGKLHKKENPYISWQENRYDEIIDFIFSCKNLKSISLAGGEPFYNKRKLFGLLDKLDRSIELKFITNASFCDDEIIDKLNEFDNGRLNCSIDGVGRWIENQRLRSNWNKVEENMFTFSSELNKGWIITLVPTFTVINTLGLPEYIDWYINKLFPIRNVKFSYTICKNPPRMTLYQLPLKQRIEIVNKIKSKNYQYQNVYLDEAGKQYTELNQINKLMENICKDKEVKDTTSLKKHVDFIKNNTEHDVLKSIPELGEIIG